MKLILFNPDRPLCDAWRESFVNLPDVEIVRGYFEHLQAYDCMVSPANSFGLMDGGIDGAFTEYFGEQLMRRVQQRILDDFLGEQPVGTSFIIETNHPKHPFLAHTPTMRVPMTIAHTDHVYKAMAAMLLAVHKHNQTAERKIEIIACPGLGTGVGEVPYKEAARQMSLAYRYFLTPPKWIDWSLATERQMRVRFGGDDGLLLPPEHD